MNYKRHTTLKDIAEVFGVSIATVSRALKDSPEISRALTMKIQAAARKMNYHPNPMAMSLRGDALRVIGVVIPDLEEFFFSSALNGMEEEARENGYFLIITTSREKYDLEVRNVESLKNMRVEGIIASLSEETENLEHFEMLKEIEMPVVFYDRVCLPKLFSSVTDDSSQAAKTLTKHLIDTGYKSIAFLGGPNHLDIVKQRKHGYCEALHEAGFPLRRDYIVCKGLTRANGKSAMEQLLNLPSPPDAVFAMTDLLAHGALEAIRGKGLRIPQDIAIAAFCDENMSRISTPRITSMSQQAYKMGRTAVRLLIDRINGSTKVEHIIVPMDFIIYESTKK